MTGVLNEHSIKISMDGNGIKISMDGKGRWVDNVFIERLWRSLKYECVYLKSFETGQEARKEIGVWIKFYNSERPHSVFEGLTPKEIYGQGMEESECTQFKKAASFK